MVQRGLFCVAAAIIVCVVGAALLQLAVMILSFSPPIAITVITLMTVILLNSLRRRIRAARGRFDLRSPRNPHGIRR